VELDGGVIPGLLPVVGDDVCIATEYSFVHLAAGRDDGALYAVLGVYAVLATLAMCLAGVFVTAKFSKWAAGIALLVAVAIFVRIAAIVLSLAAPDTDFAAPAFLPLLALMFVWMASASTTQLWGIVVPGHHLLSCLFVLPVCLPRDRNMLTSSSCS
jgi:hypothetical protein